MHPGTSVVGPAGSGNGPGVSEDQNSPSASCTHRKHACGQNPALFIVCHVDTADFQNLGLCDDGGFVSRQLPARGQILGCKICKCEFGVQESPSDVAGASLSRAEGVSLPENVL